MAEQGVEGNDARYLVIREATCPECYGQKWLSHPPRCGVCGTEFVAEELDGKNKAMPCGHGWGDLVEAEYECPTCGGKGTVREEVELAEVLAALGVLQRVEPEKKAPFFFS